MGRKRGTTLTRAAFDLAARGRTPTRGLIFHSDRGSEYAGTGLGDRLKAIGVLQSTTRGGCPADNPHAESFFHSMKADVLHGVRFTNDEQLRACIRSYIPFYNHLRSHSSLGFISPVEHEFRVA
jgi:putative transposase